MAVQGNARSVLDWAVMANMYHLQKFLARCELFIMKHYHANPSSKAFIAALSPESQLRIYRCEPIWPPVPYCKLCFKRKLRYEESIGFTPQTRPYLQAVCCPLLNPTLQSTSSCIPT